MLLNKVLRQVVAIAQPIVKKLETQVRAWTKPTTDSLVGGMVADVAKDKGQLIMENALLRQQVLRMPAPAVNRLATARRPSA